MTNEQRAILRLIGLANGSRPTQLEIAAEMGLRRKRVHEAVQELKAMGMMQNTKFCVLTPSGKREAQSDPA